MGLRRPTYLFQCGVGRSGTTILRRSLGRHEQIYYNGAENNVVQDIVEVAQRNCTIPSRKLSMVVDQKEYNAAFLNLINSIIWPDDDLRQRPVRLAAINATPSQLDFVLELVPEAKIIAIVRNGIEVVSSRMEYKSFASNDFVSHCDVWARSSKIVAWGQQNKSRFMLMRHEWLYDTQIVAEKFDRLYQWLSIDGSTGPLDHVQSNLAHPTSSPVELVDTFELTNQGQKREYFNSKRERWKSWTHDQRLIFEEICLEGMQQLGYQVPWIE